MSRDASGVDITPCLQARDADWRKKLTASMTETFKKAQDEIAVNWMQMLQLY